MSVQQNYVLRFVLPSKKSFENKNEYLQSIRLKPYIQRKKERKKKERKKEKKERKIWH